MREEAQSVFGLPFFGYGNEMKIGVSASALGKGGGMERYALDVIGGLLDQGHDVVAFCRKAELSAAGMERIRDIRLVSSSFLPGKFRDAWFSRNLDRLRKTAGLDAHIACCMVEHPDIAVCGGTHRGYLAALGKKPGFFDRRKIVLETKQYANARAVVAHSRLMRDELAGLYGIDPAKIRLIYPPVDETRFRPPEEGERERLRAEFGFAPDRAVFLFPSGGHARKGLPFLRAFFESTDLPVELVIAGRGAEEGRNVRRLGYVRDIERLYRAADATVLASSYEPFGLVGVESVLCGAPAVLPENTGCCEVLDSQMLHTFRLGDAEDFRRAVGDVVERGRRGMPADPRTAVRYDCGVRRHAEELIACLEASERA